jgi:tRNA threonylcarbamoyladenosine biosynthesis protein TsaE
VGRVALVSGSPAETEAIAGRLAALLRPRDLVTVSGELGSGKTTFVRGAARALGVTSAVTSPTYTIGHRYDGVSHLDLYRLERLTDADWGAVEPYLEDAICFVEWPERAAGWLPPERVAVTLRHLGSVRRLVVLESSERDLLEGVFGGADPRS